ncbi:MAG: histidine phosphatase family protein [Alphaproteobacteria bacterium]|nr:histidine phosphatase family protein [Alphaproteobacteria bacterium]MCL2757752.1 histidine phosphatase family protein [Alphaproteobacteria bacterium]
MKKLCIFRHGQTDWNREGRNMGWADIPLNGTGREQANKLAEDLQNVGLEVIYSSPSSRCIETAQIVAKFNNVKIIMDNSLQERNISGGESMTRHEQRVIPAINNIIKTSAHNIMGISTSNGTALWILENVLGRELPPFNIPNAGYYCLDWDGENLKLSEVPEWLAPHLINRSS